MGERLARLHDTHDSRVDLVLPVLEDSLCRLLVLVLCLAHLDRIDLDTKELVFESRVKIKLIVVLDLSALGLLAQHAHLAARERL